MNCETVTAFNVILFAANAAEPVPRLIVEARQLNNVTIESAVPDDFFVDYLANLWRKSRQEGRLGLWFDAALTEPPLP